MAYDRVTPERLALFLDRLVREFRRPGCLYLVGGTGLLYQGLKVGTKDIDLAYDIAVSDRDAFARALVRLRHDLNIAVEKVSPGDFIPLPRATAEGHLYLGRKGELDIFAFDPVATALAKLARYRQADLDDVLALLHAGQLSLDTLVAAFEEILPRVAAGEALKITAEEYRVKVSTFLAVAQERGFSPTTSPGSSFLPPP